MRWRATGSGNLQTEIKSAKSLCSSGGFTTSDGGGGADGCDEGVFWIGIDRGKHGSEDPKLQDHDDRYTAATTAKSKTQRLGAETLAGFFYDFYAAA
jgi:hypothetical protein